MKRIFIMFTVVLLSATACQSQISNGKTETVTINGNCDSCKTAIEKAGTSKKISATSWNKDSKTATILFNSKKTTLDAVLKKIALAGYDNELFLAPDEAYNKLESCCRYNRDLKVAVKIPVKDTIIAITDHSGHTQPTTIVTPPVQESNQLQVVFDNYFAVKDALVKTDGAAALTKAKALLTALDAVDMNKLKTDAHMAWMKVEKELKADAKKISAKKDAASQRMLFMNLSEKMYTLIKAAKPAGKIYYQHCPMYNEGKGANWLSKEPAIKNPYYGSVMLTCGSIAETIQ